jgi:hypothetical protein
MVTSQLLVGLANGIFLLVCAAVGIRLFALAHRTRQRPELLLGIGFVGVFLGVLALALSGLGRLPSGEIRLGFAGVGFASMWLATVGFLGFTWQTFRTHSKWAGVFVGFWGLCLGLLWAGAFHALATAAPESGSSESVRSWVVGARLMVAAAGAWTATEAYLQHSMECRRLAIGLGDCLIANRFVLWALCGFFICLNNSVSALLQSQGIGPMNSTLGAAMLTVGGLTQAVVMTLGLMPPSAYLRFIEARASSSAA